MNTERSDSGAEMGNLIDRLVCGEIDEPARGRLLAWLEEQPTRWRLCGLAFLETQVWSHALGTWHQDGDEQLAHGEASCDDAKRGDIPDTVARRASEEPAELLTRMVSEDSANRVPRSRVGFVLSGSVRSPRSARLGYAAALAASVLVAFGLGLLSRGAFFGSNGHSAPVAAGGPAATGDQPLPPENSVAARVPDEAAAASDQPVLASITARAGLGPAETSFQIPVVPATGTSTQAADSRSIVPEYVRQQWERRGFAVETQRRYLFATLPSGERVVVPVDNVQFNKLPIKVY